MFFYIVDFLSPVYLIILLYIGSGFGNYLKGLPSSEYPYISNSTSKTIIVSCKIPKNTYFFYYYEDTNLLSKDIDKLNLILSNVSKSFNVSDNNCSRLNLNLIANYTLYADEINFLVKWPWCKNSENFMLSLDLSIHARILCLNEASKSKNKIQKSYGTEGQALTVINIPSRENTMKNSGKLDASASILEIVKFFEMTFLGLNNNSKLGHKITKESALDEVCSVVFNYLKITKVPKKKVESQELNFPENRDLCKVSCPQECLATSTNFKLLCIKNCTLSTIHNSLPYTFLKIFYQKNELENFSKYNSEVCIWQCLEKAKKIFLSVKANCQGECFKNTGKLLYSMQILMLNTNGGGESINEEQRPLLNLSDCLQACLTKPGDEPKYYTALIKKNPKFDVGFLSRRSVAPETLLGEKNTELLEQPNGHCKYTMWVVISKCQADCTTADMEGRAIGYERLERKPLSQGSCNFVSKVRKCEMLCPVDCVIGDWEGDCDAICSNDKTKAFGVAHETRQISHSKNGGMPCPPNISTSRSVRCINVCKTCEFIKKDACVNTSACSASGGSVLGQKVFFFQAAKKQSNSCELYKPKNTTNGTCLYECAMLKKSFKKENKPEDRNLKLPVIAGTIAAVASIVIAVTVILTVYKIRKRKTYKKGMDLPQYQQEQDATDRSYDNPIFENKEHV